MKKVLFVGGFLFEILQLTSLFLVTFAIISNRTFVAARNSRVFQHFMTQNLFFAHTYLSTNCFGFIFCALQSLLRLLYEPDDFRG